MNPMRLIRGEPETRQEKMLREIRERQQEASYGMGTIDPRPTGNYIPVDEVLKRSVRPIDKEKPVLCTYCKRELIPSLPEEERDREIDARDGDTIFWLHNEMVCESCYFNDETEREYIKADMA